MTEPVDGPATDVATFTITRGGDPMGWMDMVMVNYAFSGPASFSTDYTATAGGSTLWSSSGSLMFNPMEMSKTITLAAMPDGWTEGNEPLTLTLSSGFDYTIEGTGVATATIGEIAPTVAVSAPVATTSEPTSTTHFPTPGTFRITRQGNTMGSLIVQFQLGGTATLTADYTLSADSFANLQMPSGGNPGQVTIAAGASSVDIQVAPAFGLETEGNETVVLTLVDNDNPAYDVTTASGTVTIVDAPPPTFTFPIAPPTVINEGSIVSFSISASTQIDYYEVLWGDESGSQPTPQRFDTNGAAQTNLHHPYLDDNPTATPSDTVQVRIKAWQGTNSWNVAPIPLTINNVAPVMSGELFLSNTTPTVGMMVTANAGFADGVSPSQDTLNWKILWGDGASSDGTATSGIAIAHTYAAVGEYTVTLKVWDDDMTDADAITRTATLTVSTPTTPPNRDPVISNGQTTRRYTYHFPENLEVTSADGLKSGVIDPDGDPLFIEVVENVSHGTIEIDNAGGFRYEPDTDSEMTDDHFKYYITDHVGNRTALIDAVIEPMNQPPFARPDAYYVRAEQMLEVTREQGVLSNDTDEDDETIFLGAWIVDGPEHGELELDADGGFRYTPNEGYVGHDSFRYRVSDPGSADDEETVNLEIIQPPVILGATATELYTAQTSVYLPEGSADRFRLTSADVADFEQWRQSVRAFQGPATVPASATGYSDLLNYVELAETALASARADSDRVEEVANDPTADKQTFLEALRSATASYEIYRYRHYQADRCCRQFMDDQWWVSGWDEALVARVENLPESVGWINVGMSADEWNERRADRRELARSVSDGVRRMEVAAAATSGTLASLGMASVVIGVTIVCPPIGVTFGLSALTNGVVHSYERRGEFDLVGTVQDLSGATSLAIGLTGYDPVTGQPVTPENQGEQLGAGAVQLTFTGLTAYSLWQSSSSQGGSSGSGGSGGGGTPPAPGTPPGSFTISQAVVRGVGAPRAMAAELPRLNGAVAEVSSALRAVLADIQYGINRGSQVLRTTNDLITTVSAEVAARPFVTATMGTVGASPLFILSINPDAAAPATTPEPPVAGSMAHPEDPPPEETPETRPDREEPDNPADPVSPEPTESGLCVVQRPGMTERVVVDANGNPVSIYGQSGSSSTTPGHAAAIESLAEQLAATGEYEYVLMQRSWRTATGRVGESNRVPDVIGVRRNGTVDAFEIQSRTDNPQTLQNRLDAGMDTLPDWRQGSTRVLTPEDILNP